MNKGLRPPARTGKATDPGFAGEGAPWHSGRLRHFIKIFGLSLSKKSTENDNPDSHSYSKIYVINATENNII